MTLSVEVAFPFYLASTKTIRRANRKTDVIEILRLVESYVFRRAICGIPTTA